MRLKSIDDKISEEKKLISQMIEIYSSKKLKQSSLDEKLLTLEKYAHERLDRCPKMSQKTFCSSCAIHCYDKNKQDEIKEIMKFSGKYLLFIKPTVVIKHILDSFWTSLKKCSKDNKIVKTGKKQ